MLFVSEQIRRIRSTSALDAMRSSDGRYYIVRFQRNLQHPRIFGERVARSDRYHTEFAAVTDVWLALGEAGIEPVAREGLAVWVAKLWPSCCRKRFHHRGCRTRRELPECGFSLPSVVSVP